jgi:hypothetical protein
VFGKVFSDHMLEIEWDDEVRANAQLGATRYDVDG